MDRGESEMNRHLLISCDLNAELVPVAAFDKCTTGGTLGTLFSVWAPAILQIRFQSATVRSRRKWTLAGALFFTRTTYFCLPFSDKFTS